MAKQLKSSWAWTYNRHDRKRGTQPPDCICRNRDCAENLHDVGIFTYEGTLRMLAGRYTVGETEGGVVLEVRGYDDFSADILCAECNTAQPQLHLEDIVFEPEAITFAEMNQGG